MKMRSLYIGVPSLVVGGLLGVISAILWAKPSSIDEAAWVQAGGTIAAIAIGFGGVVWQSNQQHKMALERDEAGKRHQTEEITEKVLAIGRLCRRFITVDIETLGDWSQFNRDEYIPVDVEKYAQMDAMLSSIRMLELPADLIRPALGISAHMRIYLERISEFNGNYRTYNQERFEKAVAALGRSRKSIDDLLKKLRRENSK